MEKLKYAQDLIKTSNTYVASGFNQFIMGHKKPDFGDGYSPQEAYARIQGYEYAEEMAKKERSHLPTGLSVAKIQIVTLFNTEAFLSVILVVENQLIKIGGR